MKGLIFPGLNIQNRWTEIGLKIQITVTVLSLHIFTSKMWEYLTIFDQMLKLPQSNRHVRYSQLNIKSNNGVLRAENGNLSLFTISVSAILKYGNNRYRTQWWSSGGGRAVMKQDWAIVSLVRAELKVELNTTKIFFLKYIKNRKVLLAFYGLILGCNFILKVNNLCSFLW